MTAKEVAEKNGIKLWKVYALARKLGRLPSKEEIEESKNKKLGRPQKYKEKE